MEYSKSEEVNGDGRRKKEGVYHEKKSLCHCPNSHLVYSFVLFCFNKSFLLSILLAFFYSIFNWGILGTVGTSISAAKIAFLNSFPVICVMNWTSGLMMEHLQKDNLLPEAYAIVPTTCHTIFILAITVTLSLWLIIRFYKKWTR